MKYKNVEIPDRFECPNCGEMAKLVTVWEYEDYFVAVYACDSEECVYDPERDEYLGEHCFSITIPKKRE